MPTRSPNCSTAAHSPRTPPPKPSKNASISEFYYLPNRHRELLRDHSAESSAIYVAVLLTFIN